jgi:hypothetical protein
MWIATALYTIGSLVYIPAQFSFIYSRLHLLQPGPIVARCVNYALILEYLLAEVPATCLFLVAANTPFNAKLNEAIEVYVAVEVVLLSSVVMIVSGLYFYLAWRTSNHVSPAICGTF